MYNGERHCELNEMKHGNLASELRIRSLDATFAPRNNVLTRW